MYISVRSAANSVTEHQCTKLKRGGAGHSFGALHTAFLGNAGADWTDPLEEHDGKPSLIISDVENMKDTLLICGHLK